MLKEELHCLQFRNAPKAKDIHRVQFRTAPKPEIRSAEDGTTTISGYAVVFNTKSEDLGGWQEMIRPGAFRKSLRDYPDVKAYIEHDPARIIGRTLAGSLTLNEDDYGLAFSVTPPATTIANDAIVNLKSGNLDKMSFAFSLESLDGRRWSEDGTLREILEARLWEISIVSNPAYPSSSVHARHLADRNLEDSIELRAELAEAQEKRIAAETELTETKKLLDSSVSRVTSLEADLAELRSRSEIETEWLARLTRDLNQGLALYRGALGDIERRLRVRQF